MARLTDEQLVEFALDLEIGICDVGVDRVCPLKKEGSLKIQPSYLRDSFVTPDLQKMRLSRRTSSICTMLGCGEKSASL